MDVIQLADGTNVPKKCVEALDALESTWPGASFAMARPAIVKVVLEAFRKETAS